MIEMLIIEASSHQQTIEADLLSSFSTPLPLYSTKQVKLCNRLFHSVSGYDSIKKELLNLMVIYNWSWQIQDALMLMLQFWTPFLM